MDQAAAAPAPADASAQAPSAPPPRRRIRWTAILALVAIVALAVALWKSDPAAAWQVLVRVPAGHVLAVVGLVLLAYVLRFAKWHLFLVRLGLQVPLGRSAAVFASGLLMVVTPAKVGEVWKAMALRESDGIPVPRSLGAVALERLTDFAAVAALALLATQSLGLPPWLAVAALVAFGLGIGLLRWKRPWKALLARLEARKPGSRPVAFLHALYDGTSSLLSPGTLAAGGALGLAAWALEGLALWVLLDGVGVDADPLWAVGVFCVGTLAGVLSVLPGGLGTAEAGMVALLVAGGVAAPTAFAAALLARVLTLGLGAALGGVCYAVWTTRRPAAKLPAA